MKKTTIFSLFFIFIFSVLFVVHDPGNVFAESISQTNWSLQYVDSEELVGSDGAAVNAFDGDSGTIWHTEWSSSKPTHPHEIQIDLDDIYNLDGFRYLPRQDGYNGNILQYQFYVSADGINWGSPVAEGSFSGASDPAEKEILFSSAITGQFIRLVALDEVNGKKYTSMAELNMLGTHYEDNLPPNGTIDSPADNVTITIGESVDFSGTGSDPDNDLPLTYNWNFGDPAIDDAAVEVPGLVQFDTVGTYTVIFTVTDALGLADATPATVQVTVEDIPGNLAPEGTIDSPADNVTITIGESVDFAGTGSDPDNDLPLTYNWNFGDPAIDDASVEDPGLVQFDTVGTYTVIFTVTDALGLADATPATRIIHVEDSSPGNLISQTNWSLQYVDSEELVGSDGAAVNAFDGDSGTIWHTEWSSSKPTHPHEIQIDLDDIYNLDGFRYLPRQDGYNGNILQYQFYVSADGINWGSPVAEGSFSGASDPAEKEILFSSAITGQFIRLVALDEVNGKKYTSMAELNMLGALYEDNLPPNGTIDSPADNVTITIGESVDFSGTGSDPDNDLPLTYNWNFGDPAIDDAAVEVPGLVQFDTVGTYTVIFTVTDALGLADATPATVQVTVEDIPGNLAPEGTIDSPADNVTITIGESVDFSGTGSDPDNDLPLTYNWNFGDPAIDDASVEDPGLVQFDTVGTYTVIFTVTDALGLADATPATVQVTVEDIPGNLAPEGTIDSPADNVTITIGESVDFAGTGSDPDNDLPLTYNWNFGDPAIDDASVEDPGLVQFDTVGTYTVIFTVTDALGLADATPATRIIHVEDSSPGNLISQTNWSLQYVDSEELVGSDGAAVNAFDGDSGTIWHTEWSSSKPTHPHEIQIDLDDIYNLDGFRYLPRQDGYNGNILQYQFYVSADGINWGSPVAEGSFSGASDPAEKEILFSSAITGQFIRLVALDEVNGKKYTSMAELNMLGTLYEDNLPPNGTIDSPADNVTITIGESVDFSGTGSDPDNDLPLTYNWNFGDPAIDDAAVEVPGLVQFDTVGTYTVIFTVTDALGLADATPATVQVTVEDIPGNLAPEGTIDSPADNVTITIGESVDFSGTGSDPDNDLPLTYNWNFGDPAIDDASVEDPGLVQFDTVGTYTVIFTVTDALGLADATPATVQVTVEEIPGNLAPEGTIDSPADNVTITIGESVDFSGTGSDPDNDLPLTYNWNFGDPAIDDASVEDPGLVQFDTVGTYTVIFTVTDALGLADATPATVQVTVEEIPGNLAPEGTIDSPADNVTITIGESVDFSGTGSDPDNDLPLTYNWNFGDPAIDDASVEDPGLVQFDTSGTYVVSFTVTDSLGLSDPSPALLYIHVLDNDNTLIPQSGWTVHYVDSEETTAGDHAAVKSFDGDPATFWHTQYSGGAPYPPHEIQINLGDFYDINGFRYLPRQDGNTNGRIYQYEFYVSSDGSNWGNPVAQGAFVNTPGEKEIQFPLVTSKFVRLIALTEINDREYSAVAELNLLGGNFSGNHAPESTIDAPVTNLTIGIGDSVEFMGTGSDFDNHQPLTYLWTFGDSVIPFSNLEDPGTVQFNAAGTYIVEFTVIDALGRADSTPATRVINVESDSSDFLIPQANWSLQYVDSEELIGADGAAINSFDGNPNTIWHTEWFLQDPPPPHEIQIDLGSAYEIYGLHYLPRQDGSNGTITEYEVYVSSDGADWGVPVATGTLVGDNTEKQIVFAPKTGQFITLVALNSVDNDPWTSAAEINVKGRCDTPYVKILQPEDYALSPYTDLPITTSVCLNSTQHSGWGVKFTIDGSSEYIDYSTPYSVTYLEAARTEHIIDAVIVDNLGIEIEGSMTQDQVIQVGIGDYYVAIGDSITSGVGDDILSDNISQDGRNPEGGYTPILNDLLTGTKGYPHTIAMEGIPGFTSAQGLDFLPTVLSRHPDSQYYLLLYGTNDAGGMFPETPATFKDNLQQIIDMIKSTNKEAYLAKVPYSLDTVRNSIIQDYNVVIDELVSDNAILIAPPDYYTYFETHQDELSDDLHPDGSGYQEMAEMWRAALQ